MNSNYDCNSNVQTRKIHALFNEDTITIYQAYSERIAKEAIKLGRFGKSFKKDRMTWIKPSFLWMMYRSGWATKENQERILAINITREGFETILNSVILSTYSPEIYNTYELWKEKLSLSEARCQWDPDRDIKGNPIQRRAIQLVIKKSLVEKYIKCW